MIRIRAGDLIAIRARRLFYHALILSKIRFFGGNWIFAFHKTSTRPLPADTLLRENPRRGFHAFVDFYHAKRKDRIAIVAKRVDTALYNKIKYLKLDIPKQLRGLFGLKKRENFWRIIDFKDPAFREVKAVKRLSAAEKRLPLFETISVDLMFDLIENKWTPEKGSLCRKP